MAPELITKIDYFIKTHMPVDFIYKDDLLESFKLLLKDFDMSDAILEDENWYAFVHILNAILADQPIKDPTKKMEYFVFKPFSSKGKEGAKWIIKFKDDRGVCKFVDTLIRR